MAVEARPKSRNLRLGSAFWGLPLKPAKAWERISEFHTGATPTAKPTRSDSEISEISTFKEPLRGHDSKGGTEFREGRFPLFPTVAGTCRVVKAKDCDGAR